MTHQHLIARLLAGLMIVSLVGCDRQNSSHDHASEGQTESAASTAEAETESMADIPADQKRSGPTENDTYFVEVVPQPNPIPFQELFGLKVRVLDPSDRETPVEGVAIDEVQAVMPAHDHGMKTSPQVDPTGPGTFQIDGMRFHMRGEGEDGRWVIRLVINGERGIDEAKFDVQCCRPDQ